MEINLNRQIHNQQNRCLNSDSIARNAVGKSSATPAMPESKSIARPATSQ